MSIVSGIFFRAILVCGFLTILFEKSQSGSHSYSEVSGFGNPSYRRTTLILRNRATDPEFFPRSRDPLGFENSVSLRNFALSFYMSQELNDPSVFFNFKLSNMDQSHVLAVLIVSLTTQQSLISLPETCPFFYNESVSVNPFQVGLIFHSPGDYT